MNRRNLRTAGSINAGIWLIGLGILWLTNTWWPGILILIGLSMLAQSIIYRQARQPAVMADAPPAAPVVEPEEMQFEPEVKEDPRVSTDEEDATPSFMKEETVSQPEPETPVVDRNSWLPETCPACGGPVASNADKVTWPGETMAKCPFCGVYLKVRP
jgi:hypothetical protein